MTSLHASRGAWPLAIVAFALNAAAQESMDDRIGSPAAAGAKIDVEARARSLFEDGRQLLESGRVAEACQSFIVSEALVPSIGTLLNLGLCHRAQGKVATALTFFRAAATLASSKGDLERREVAEQNAKDLEPLVDPSATPADEPKDRVPSAPPSRLRAPPAKPRAVAGSEPDPARWRKIAAVTSGAVGLVGLGAAIGFGLAARSASQDSAQHCTAFDVCDATGVSLRHSADARATRADVATVIGVVGLGGGLAFWLTLPNRERPRSPSSTARLSVGPLGVVLSEEF